MFLGNFPAPDALRLSIEAAHRMSETEAVDIMLREAALDEKARARIQVTAQGLVKTLRQQSKDKGGLDAFMHEYELSNQEGVTLMCLAEALLRIPDAETANRLIKDKIVEADWQAHIGNSESVFVNASTWALMLTGRVIEMEDISAQDIGSFFKRLIGKSGEPVIRQAMTQAMKIMGRQFVMGQTIDEALKRAKTMEKKGYRYSFDMLGEAARTDADALQYLEAYSSAIATVGRHAEGLGCVRGAGVSVKLSALHPRYELAQRERLFGELVPRILRLAREAKAVNISLCIDAEEADRLEVSLDVLEVLAESKELVGWNGLGLAVQSYQKRALSVIDWLEDLAGRTDRQLMVRLVKGAYWDTEIKRAQEQGLDTYPVFTRKNSTDVSYLACAKRLLMSPEQFFPQFATHNAHSLATVIEMAPEGVEYEFQCLHGMGEPLYSQIVEKAEGSIPCRIYAPVGSHEDLLAYLVRRLLENGANTSFVNRIVDESAPIAEITADPWERVTALASKPHPQIPLPNDLYGSDRNNSKGIDLADPASLRILTDQMNTCTGPWVAGNLSNLSTPIYEPGNRAVVVGLVHDMTQEDLDVALTQATTAAPRWDGTSAHVRADILEKAAYLIEQNTPELLVLCVREAGKTATDAVPEIREAVDFLRYYARRARIDFADPLVMPGPTGEGNLLSLHGRGVFACISPWNFPLAIFLGQVSAALAAGNAVIAKPAEQTPLIAAKAVELLYQAGVPRDVLHLAPGDGALIGGALVSDPRVSGVAFTGSTKTARLINQVLANRNGPIIPLIAETGGQNVMIADSSALPEQIVEDAVYSAFRSAGQRCSALRVMFVQQDIAGKVMEMLAGATEELSVADPAQLSSDVGPVIDSDALQMLENHVVKMEKQGLLICQATLSKSCKHGTFFAPRAFQIDNLSLLEQEVFGPILHVIPYAAEQLDTVIEQINSTGYGLTLGIHSRVNGTRNYIHQRTKVGNTYVNRNMIGAVVGVQPFGGEGLSGTGPKAGGPRYLYRFAVERTLTINTTASGGNTDLMSLQE